MLREYELTVVVNSQISDEETKNLFEKYESIILEDGGEIVRRKDWGSKKLAFPMNKVFRGRFMHYDLTAHPSSLAEGERLMRIDDNVLRYLTIRIGEDVDVEERKLQLAKLEAEAEAQRENEKKR